MGKTTFIHLVLAFPLLLRRLFLACPHWPRPNHFLLDSNTLDLGPCEQANIRSCSLVEPSQSYPFLGFRGDIEHLDDIVSQIEILILNKSDFRFLNQLQ